MKHIKKYNESLFSRKEPEEFQEGEKLKFIENGKTVYCEYDGDYFNTDNIVKFFIPIDKRSLVYVLDENGKFLYQKEIKKSKLMHLTELEKEMDKYNL